MAEGVGTEELIMSFEQELMYKAEEERKMIWTDKQEEAAKRIYNEAAGNEVWKSWDSLDNNTKERWVQVAINRANAAIRAAADTMISVKSPYNLGKDFTPTNNDLFLGSVVYNEWADLHGEIVKHWTALSTEKQNAWAIRAIEERKMNKHFVSKLLQQGLTWPNSHHLFIAKIVAEPEKSYRGPL